MKKLLLVLAVAAAVAAPVASAGGWATVGLSSLPTGTAAGANWSVDMTVLQHGRTPLEGIAPVLTITNDDGESRQFTGTPTGKPGVYHAEVVFPSSGMWSYQVWDDFGRTHTFKPVEIAAPGIEVITRGRAEQGEPDHVMAPAELRKLGPVFFGRRWLP